MGSEYMQRQMRMTSIERLFRLFSGAMDAIYLAFLHGSLFWFEMVGNHPKKERTSEMKKHFSFHLID